MNWKVFGACCVCGLTVFSIFRALQSTSLRSICGYNRFSYFICMPMMSFSLYGKKLQDAEKIESIKLHMWAIWQNLFGWYKHHGVTRLFFLLFPRDCFISANIYARVYSVYYTQTHTCIGTLYHWFHQFSKINSFFSKLTQLIMFACELRIKSTLLTRSYICIYVLFRDFEYKSQIVMNHGPYCMFAKSENARGVTQDQRNFSFFY